MKKPTSPKIIKFDSVKQPEKGATGRVLPRQVSTGTMRGNQIVTGVFQMNDTDNVPRMIIDAPNSVIKISDPGVNVLNAPDSELIFNSNQNIFKIIDVLEFPQQSYTTGAALTGEVATDVTSFEIEHDYGFAPAITGYIPDDSGNYYQMPRTSYGIGGDNIAWVQITSQLFSTESVITWQVTTFLSAVGSAGGISANLTVGPVKVYVLQETAA